MSLDTDALTQLQFPDQRSCPFHPPQSYIEMQQEAPVARVELRSGLVAWMLTRHEDIRTALDDERLSANEDIDGYPHLYDQGFQSPLRGTFMRLDGEPHYKIRRMLTKHFTVAKAAALRPSIEAIVDGCLDAMQASGNEVDLVEGLAFPVPSSVICEVLGVSYEDREIFKANTRAMIDVESTMEEVQAAFGAIFGFLAELVAKKQQDPGDDLISKLVTEELADGLVGMEELVTVLLILLVAGHETTSSMIGLGSMALIEHPDQLAVVQQRPELWANAVDEILRHQTIVQAPIQRVAVADIEIGGQLIRKGEGVIAVVEAGNRDAGAFEQPEKLDLTRNARNHLGFSFGPHQCLGHALARLELEIVYSRLFSRFPNLSLALPADQVEMRPPTVGLYGVNELRVKLT